MSVAQSYSTPEEGRPEGRTTFVLSSGRTGTVFLTHTLPEHYPHLHAVHEPPGSRSTLMLGNVRNTLGIGSRIVDFKFRRALRRRRQAVPPSAHYLEINPMLVGLTDLLADEVQPLRLVHMVRHPRSWVRSIRKFKASTKFRAVIDYVPFGTPFPSPRPRGWLTMDEITKALWRWRFANDQILEIRPKCAMYVRIRYEDLFGGPGETRDRALSELFSALELDPLEDPELLFEKGRVNPAPSGERVDVPEADIERICGDLMHQFGYTL